MSRGGWGRQLANLDLQKSWRDSAAPEGQQPDPLSEYTPPSSWRHQVRPSGILSPTNRPEPLSPASIQAAAAATLRAAVELETRPVVRAVGNSAANRLADSEERLQQVNSAANIAKQVLAEASMDADLKAFERARRSLMAAQAELRVLESATSSFQEHVWQLERFDSSLEAAAVDGDHVGLMSVQHGVVGVEVEMQSLVRQLTACRQAAESVRAAMQTVDHAERSQDWQTAEMNEEALAAAEATLLEHTRWVEQSSSWGIVTRRPGCMWLLVKRR